MEQDRTDRYIPVELHTRSQMLNGYIFCPVNSRISDMLNGTHVAEQNAKSKFLECIFTLDDESKQSFEQITREYVGKSSIDLLALADGELRRGIGGRKDQKVYPYKEKNRALVKLQFSAELNTYSLVGYIHCDKGQTARDVVEDDRPFLVLTKVTMLRGYEIYGTRPFVAINKQQIISFREEPTGEAPAERKEQSSEVVV